MTTPTTLWPIGQKYVTVITVTMKNQHGIMDPSITERMCLPNEAGAYIVQTMQRNPHATAYVSHHGVWYGARNER